MVVYGLVIGVASYVPQVRPKRTPSMPTMLFRVAWNFWASDDGGLRAVNQEREGQQLEHWENRCARKGCGTFTADIRVKIPNNGIKCCMREAATNSSC